MTLPGRVHNGVVVLEGDFTLPEGTEVSVLSRATPVLRVSKHQKRIQVPLVRSSKPGSLHLTGEMIAEILDAEDMPT
jgi:hypothetical protein